MGYAALHGKAWVIQRLQDLHRPESFVDLGAGAGSWLDAVKPWFLESKWIAVEAWPAYCERFSLYTRYDLVIREDVRVGSWPSTDVAIMGDLLEHMTERESLEVWDKAQARSHNLVLSIPIVHYPQDDVHGNPFQKHVDEDWSHERVMDTFRGITAHKLYDVVGVYTTF